MAGVSDLSDCGTPRFGLGLAELAECLRSHAAMAPLSPKTGDRPGSARFGQSKGKPLSLIRIFPIRIYLHTKFSINNIFMSYFFL
jgi:hypothetical protein